MTLRDIVRARLAAGETDIEKLWHDLEFEMPHRAVHWNYVRRIAAEWAEERAALKGAGT